jgi:hypothetical protein
MQTNKKPADPHECRFWKRCGYCDLPYKIELLAYTKNIESKKIMCDGLTEASAGIVEVVFWTAARKGWDPRTWGLQFYAPSFEETQVRELFVKFRELDRPYFDAVSVQHLVVTIKHRHQNLRISAFKIPIGIWLDRKFQP